MEPIFYYLMVQKSVRFYLQLQFLQFTKSNYKYEILHLKYLKTNFEFLPML
jgi:hypothetical protein